MDYFLLKQDKRYSNPPVIEDWFLRFDKRQLTQAEAHKIPEQMLFKIVANAQTTFIDIVEYPYFLLSQRLKELVTLYEPYLKYKEIILLDGLNKMAALYYLPILPAIDALHNSSQLARDKSTLIKGVLDEDKIGSHSLFRLDGISGYSVVARLDLVESILRRHPEGIILEKLQIERK